MRSVEARAFPWTQAPSRLAHEHIIESLRDDTVIRESMKLRHSVCPRPRAFRREKSLLRDRRRLAPTVTDCAREARAGLDEDAVEGLAHQVEFADFELMVVGAHQHGIAA